MERLRKIRGQFEGLLHAVGAQDGLSVAEWHHLDLDQFTSSSRRSRERLTTRCVAGLTAQFQEIQINGAGRVKAIQIGIRGLVIRRAKPRSWRTQSNTAVFASSGRQWVPPVPPFFIEVRDAYASCHDVEYPWAITTPPQAVRSSKHLGTVHGENVQQVPQLHGMQLHRRSGSE